jgi:hypothetical protein
VVSQSRLVANPVDLAVRGLGIARKPGSLGGYSRPALIAACRVDARCPAAGGRFVALMPVDEDHFTSG